MIAGATVEQLRGLLEESIRRAVEASPDGARNTERTRQAVLDHILGDAEVRIAAAAEVGVEIRIASVRPEIGQMTYDVKVPASVYGFTLPGDPPSEL